jgi:hypothetical protein
MYDVSKYFQMVHCIFKIAKAQTFMLKQKQPNIYSLDCLKYYVALKTMFIERKNPILN